MAETHLSEVDLSFTVAREVERPLANMAPHSRELERAGSEPADLSLHKQPESAHPGIVLIAKFLAVGHEVRAPLLQAERHWYRRGTVGARSGSKLAVCVVAPTSC